MSGTVVIAITVSVCIRQIVTFNKLLCLPKLVSILKILMLIVKHNIFLTTTIRHMFTRASAARLDEAASLLRYPFQSERMVIRNTMELKHRSRNMGR